MKPIYDTPLPKGWRKSELRNVTVRKRGYSWTKEQEISRPADGTIPVIRIPNVNDHLSLDDLLHLKDVPEVARKESGVTKDWILFVASNGNPSRIGDSVLMTEDREMVFASFLQAIASKDSEMVTPEFLASWLRIHNVHESFSRTSQQTTGLANFSWSAVKKLPVRFPDSVQEQRQVMAVFAATDEAMKAVRDQLAAARRLKTALMQQLFTKGIPGRHRKFKETKVGRIPEVWDVVHLGSLLSTTQYGLSESFGAQGEHQILRMTNIEGGVVHARDPVYIDLDEKMYEAYRLRIGDILFNRTNSLELVGRVGIVREEIGAVFASYLVRLTANDEKVDPFFLNHCLNSYGVKCRYRRFATPAVGQANINPRNLKQTLIALPKKESGEQEEVVRILAQCDAAIDALVTKQDALLRLKKSLLQNLLTGKVRVIPESRRR